MSEWVSEGVSGWVSEWVSESVSQSVSQWVSESVSQWVSESVSQSVSEWVSESVSHSVSQWASEGVHPTPSPIVPRLPRKRGGDPGTPAEPRGVHPTPWQCTLSHACHAKEAETQGRQRNPGACIRPLGNAHCPTPATQKRRRPRDASGTPGRTSDPLAVHIVPRLPRKRGGDPGTPAEPRGVHPTPWQCTLSHACHAKEAETQGRQRNPGAYIRPLGNAHCPTPATQKRRRPRDASGTPGRTSDPLTVHIVPRLPRKRGGDPGTPAEPRGVHPTPWQCTLSHACHAKEAETQGRQRNPGAYIRPLGSAHCPTPATQKRPLTVHIVPRLPWCEWVREWVSEWVRERASEWVSEWMNEWVRVWVSEWVSVWVCEWVSVWVSEWVSESEWEWVSGWVSGWVGEWVGECEWGGGRRREAEGGYRTKNKNPTRQCGEKQRKTYQLSCQTSESWRGFWPWPNQEHHHGALRSCTISRDMSNSSSGLEDFSWVFCRNLRCVSMDENYLKSIVSSKQQTRCQ